jgi:hypothetical protein
MLAPMTKLIPAAIAKNDAREEKSRMVGRGSKRTILHQPGQSSLYEADWVLKQKGR